MSDLILIIKMGVVNAYRNRKEYRIEPGAQEIVDKLNAEMYSTDQEQLTIWLKELKEKYPKSYETIKKCDPGFINTVQRCLKNKLAIFSHPKNYG